MTSGTTPERGPAPREPYVLVVLLRRCVDVAVSTLLKQRGEQTDGVWIDELMESLGAMLAPVGSELTEIASAHPHGAVSVLLGQLRTMMVCLGEGDVDAALTAAITARATSFRLITADELGPDLPDVHRELG